MIEVRRGNLPEAEAEALVNTVNCVGVMGAGVALLVKRTYPAVFRVYQQACKAGKVRPGRMLTVPTGRLDNPRAVINFPTKRHWKAPSRIEDIRTGLPAPNRSQGEIRTIAAVGSLAGAHAAGACREGTPAGMETGRAPSARPDVPRANRAGASAGRHCACWSISPDGN